MSTFDKRVMEWVDSRESSRVSATLKEVILNHMTKALEVYRRLAQYAKGGAPEQIGGHADEQGLKSMGAAVLHTGAGRNLQRQQQSHSIFFSRVNLPGSPQLASRFTSSKVATTSTRCASDDSKTNLSSTLRTSKAGPPNHHFQVRGIDYHFDSRIDEALQSIKASAPNMNSPIGPIRMPRVKVRPGERSDVSGNNAPLDNIAASVPEIEEKEPLVTSHVVKLLELPTSFVTNGDSRQEADSSNIRRKKAMEDFEFGFSSAASSKNTSITLLNGDSVAQRGPLAADSNSFGASGSSLYGSTSTSVSSNGGAKSTESFGESEDARRRTMHTKRAHRVSVVDSPIDLKMARMEDFCVISKFTGDNRIIIEALQHHCLFSFLDDTHLNKFAAIMGIEDFPEGSTILRKGEESDKLFIILSGVATAESEAGRVVQLTTGSTFGDIGLMYLSSSNSNVIANTAVQCASLNRHTYKILTVSMLEERRAQYKKFLEGVSFFSHLSPAEISRLSETLKTMHYTQGQKVIRIGESVSWIHFVIEGELEVIGSNEEHLGKVTKGGFVGHLEFLYHHLAVADVVAATLTVTTAKLSYRHFNRLIGTKRASMMKNIEEDLSFSYYREARKSASPSNPEIGPIFNDPPSCLFDEVCSEEK